MFDDPAPQGQDRWTTAESRPPSSRRTSAQLFLAPGVDTPTWGTLLALDIEQFSHRNTPEQHSLQRALQAVFDNAVQSCGIQPKHVSIEDGGDGSLIALLPATVPLERVLATLPRALLEALRDLNRLASPQAQLRLRAALHTGAVAHDHHGWTGASRDQVARMVNAPALRAALTSEPGFPMAFLISDAAFRSLVPPNTAAGYAQVTVDGLSDQEMRAWVSVPGMSDPERLLAAVARQQQTQASRQDVLGDQGLRGGKPRAG
ncbi:hypothetical protein B1C81_39070 [Streptomyces sp. HG99]|nr:hypothetical protein B1C81_39070 [Streptomyces sp. HG99]